MKRKNNAASNLGYTILRPFLRLYVIITMYPKIKYKNRVPKKGGFIFAGTHTSPFDFLLVGSSTLKPVHFLTKKELYDTKGFSWLFKFAGLIRVDRSRKNPEAINMAVDTLNDDKIVCVFPEGTINKTNDYIMPFKKGAVSFALKTGKPIVPFAILGKPKMFNYHSKILIVMPYHIQSEDLEKETKILETKVIDLIKEGQNAK